jgi:ABC-type bacteriocin/lantibiotic exporter with double-glycine peptidase domain
MSLIGPKRRRAGSYELPNSKVVRKRILGVAPLRQGARGSCGLASLRMVLEKFEIRKSEIELAKVSRTSRQVGSDERDLVRAARRLGLRAQHRKNLPFSGLRRTLAAGIPVIVAWWKVDEPHFSVAVRLDRHSIILADPEAGTFVRIKRRSFEKVWFGFIGVEKIERRGALVIHPHR